MCFETTCDEMHMTNDLQPTATPEAHRSIPSAQPSKSTDQRLSKLDTRLSRFSRHFLSSFSKGVSCRCTREFVWNSWSFFHRLETLLWRIKFSSPSLLLCAPSQAVFGGIHPVKTSTHTEVLINNNRIAGKPLLSSYLSCTYR